MKFEIKIFKSKYLYIFSILMSFFSIYLIGSLHHDFLETDIVPDPLGYDNLLKEKVNSFILESLKTKDFQKLNKEITPYKGKIAVMISDYYNFQIYYDSLENYQIISFSGKSENWEVNASYGRYEILIGGVKRKTWNSRFKHWIKYFPKSFRPNNKYNYLTIWWIYSFLFWFIGLFVYLSILNKKEE